MKSHFAVGFFLKKQENICVLLSWDIMIERLYKTVNCIDEVQAITNNQCNRCFGKNIYMDTNGIHYCLDCFNYQEINDTMKLYRSIREIESTNHVIQMRNPLTKKQKEGSDFLISCYKNRESGYLQAVCGAGKTEMTYELILQGLKEDKKICFVLPRVEVLKEVSNRFIQDFPNTTIKVLYEKNKDFEDASLLFSTPQQLIGFYHEFDLMIVDEVDAYPYSDNPLLERLVHKSIKRNGVLLFLSATIVKSYKKKICNRQIRHFTIPSRFHGKDLAVPTIIRARRNFDDIEKAMKVCNEKHVMNRQCLIFVPTKSLGNILQERMNKNDFLCHFIHSGSVDKNRTIKQFKNGTINHLITTTLLERGVTFKDIDCIISQSDHKVFSKQTIIQIAGRVGRLQDFQDGEVIMICTHVTIAMKNAIKEIKIMNKRKRLEMQTL